MAGMKQGGNSAFFVGGWSRVTGAIRLTCKRSQVQVLVRPPKIPF
jgi:hypothetical protein